MSSCAPLRAGAAGGCWRKSAGSAACDAAAARRSTDVTAVLLRQGVHLGSAVAWTLGAADLHWLEEMLCAGQAVDARNSSPRQIRAFTSRARMQTHTVARCARTENQPPDR